GPARRGELARPRGSGRREPAARRRLAGRADGGLRAARRASLPAGHRMSTTTAKHPPTPSHLTATPGPTATAGPTHHPTPTEDTAPMSLDTIQLRGVRQHNLRGFDLDLAKRTLIVVVGVSGSGKSF